MRPAACASVHCQQRRRGSGLLQKADTGCTPHGVTMRVPRFTLPQDNVCSGPHSTHSIATETHFAMPRLLVQRRMAEFRARHPESATNGEGQREQISSRTMHAFLRGLACRSVLVMFDLGAPSIEWATTPAS